MKHKIFSLFFFIFILTIFSTSLSAEELKNSEELNSRKGFFIGFGPYVGGEVNRIHQMVGVLNFESEEV